MKERIEKLAAASAQKKVGPWIGEAIRQRMEREGHIEGTPAYDIRAEALSAAELVGEDAVLTALRQVKASVFSVVAEERSAS